MLDLIILGDGDAAAAAIDEAAACGIAAVRPAWPVWSVIPGFRVDALGPDGTEPLMAPALLAVMGTRPMPFGGGPVPEWDVPRLLRAAMTFEPRCRAWMPVRDGAGRTSIPGLFVAQDETDARAVIRVMAGLAPGVGPLPCPPAPENPADIPPDAVVCPCEGVTRAAIAQAAEAGAQTMNQMRAFTRCGMGACQGRQCEAAAARVLAPLVGGPVTAGLWTMRPPLFPVPLDALMGAFTYADIPVPPPAPL